MFKALFSCNSFWCLFSELFVRLRKDNFLSLGELLKGIWIADGMFVSLFASQLLTSNVKKLVGSCTSLAAQFFWKARFCLAVRDFSWTGLTRCCFTPGSRQWWTEDMISSRLAWWASELILTEGWPMGEWVIYRHHHQGRVSLPVITNFFYILGEHGASSSPTSLSAWWTHDSFINCLVSTPFTPCDGLYMLDPGSGII